MDDSQLRAWLAQDRSDITKAVAQAIADHVAALRRAGVDFYGYGLIMGESYEVDLLAAVVNPPEDVKVAPDHKMYRYYRYSVDEWKRWDREAMQAAQRLLYAYRQTFQGLHHRQTDSTSMDEYEILDAKKSYEAVLEGFDCARRGGVFKPSDPFLVIWVSDSEEPIMAQSVRQLNSQAVADDFFAEFTSLDTEPRPSRGAGSS